MRGHAAELKVPTAPWGYFDLETNVAGEVVKLFIAEPLTRREHQTTQKEEADRLRGMARRMRPNMTSILQGV